MFKVYVDRNTILLSQNLNSGLFFDKFSYKGSREYIYFFHVSFVDFENVFALWSILGQVRSCKVMTGLWRFHNVTSQTPRACSKILFRKDVSYRSQSTVNVQLLIEWFFIIRVCTKVRTKTGNKLHHPRPDQITLDQAISPRDQSRSHWYRSPQGQSR